MKVEFAPPGLSTQFCNLQEGQWFRWADALCCKVGRDKLFIMDSSGGHLDTFFGSAEEPLQLVGHKKIIVTVNEERGNG